MKKKDIKIVQIGCGKMSKYLMRYALDNSIEIIAAFDQNPNLIGKDISSVIGGKDTGIVILHINDLAESLKTEKPDCAVVATQSLLKDVAPLLSTCAQYGVNVITTCDEALFPWNSSPVLTADLDKLAREHNCSIMGGGFPDLSYCHMVAAAAGSAHKIHRIKGSAGYNVDDYGIALAEHHGAGYSQEQFDQEIASPNRLTQVDIQELINKGEFKPIPMWNANGWLCARFGLTVIKQEQVCEPIVLDVDIFSRTLNRIIPKGEVTGMRSIARTETQEGIFIETESIGKVYQEGEVDTNDWIISGEVDIHVSNSQIHNAEMICSLMVHRIVDVINAPSGFTTSDQLAPARYFVKPMSYYIK